MGLHFDIVDVFTDRAYTGNQLAVVHRARTLTAAQMQAIAREFNLSETAFPTPRPDGRSYDVRIFTPTAEIPFAGHPSLAADRVLAEDHPVCGWFDGERTQIEQLVVQCAQR